MKERLRGTGRVFQRKGSTLWWISYYHGKHEVRESSGSTNPKDAEKLLKHRLEEIGADNLGLKTFVGPSGERVLLGELLDALESDLRLRGLRSFSRLLSQVKRIRAEFGDRRVVDVTAELVDQYIESRLRDGARPATVNRETGVLVQAFRLAVDRKKLSMAPKIRKLSEKGNARQGFFERADFERVAAGLSEYLRGFTWFGYLSGWRKGEIASLRWTDVDRSEQIIRLRPEHSKNAEGRVLALEGELWNLIERQWQSRQYKRPDGVSGVSQLVFHWRGEPIREFRKTWASACKAANVPGMLFHDLRRTAIRNMVRAGVPERVAMGISGHKTRDVFDRYNIVSEADIRQAVKQVQAYLAARPSEQKVVAFPAD